MFNITQILNFDFEKFMLLKWHIDLFNKGGFNFYNGRFILSN